jgi:hypothetical protein
MNPSTTLKKKLESSSVLVLGKGPSLTREAYAQAAVGHITVGINQTAASFPVDLAFFIDIEPFREVAAVLCQGSCLVILPWHPNERIRGGRRSGPMEASLTDLVKVDPYLELLDREGRLFYFHTAPPIPGYGDNVFRPNLVSLSSLLQLLAEAGVKIVKTLGIDGGAGYSNDLPDSALKTQLVHGYSKQFPILRKISIGKGLIMERANLTPLCVYVGCEPEQKLAARVLEHSILRHTNFPVRIRRLNECLAEDRQMGGRTPFSMQRFLIPELNENSGLAVYLDSDMLVFRDISELISLRDPAAVVSSAPAPPGSGRRPQYSVMVIDCERAQWDPEEIIRRAEDDYESVMFRLDFEPSKTVSLPFQWNSLEQYDKETRLVHFTDMERQPWISTENPLTPIWMDALFEAMKDDFVSFDEIVEGVQKGWLRPGLIWQVERQERDPNKMPRREKLKDSMFSPPHTVARFSKINNRAVRAALAVAKRAVHWVRG